MKPKVIKILPHSPPAFFTSGPRPEHYLEMERSPFWVGFWERDWHVQVASQILRYTDKYEVECWRPYIGIDKVYSKEINGITHRVFPSKKISLRGRFSYGEYSHRMVKVLRETCREGKVLLHLHGISTLLQHSLLLRANLKGIPVVAQNHENVTFRSLFSSRKWFLHLGIISLVEKRIVGNIDHLFVLTTNEKADWSTVYKGPIQIQTMGVDFEIWKPGNKAEARDKHNLPQHCHIMLSASNLLPKKGIHYVLQALPEVVESYPDILLLIAGLGSEEYEARLKGMVNELSLNEQVKFLGGVDDETLLHLYNAADVFVSASSAEGGPVSAMKALATSTPLITTEVGNVGEMMREAQADFLVSSQEPGKFTEAILNFLGNPEEYKDMRERARERYSWGKIVENTLQVYDRLFDNYWPG